MDSSKSPSGSQKRHSRNISINRPRRATRGPLEASDDPLAGNADAAPVEAVRTSIEQIPLSSTAEQAPFTSTADLEPDENTELLVDLSFLLDPANFVEVPSEDIAAEFLNSQNQPPAGTSLPDLLKDGHFRRAAEAALNELSQCSLDNAPRIFQALYTRLACLILISRPDLASHEAAPLTDFLARNQPGADEIVPLIPWELRLLLVRLQSISAVDGGRRGVMALYALAAEVRAHVAEARVAGKVNETIAWSERLRDLGLRVADTLVEMGELETATRHLDTLDANSDELAYRKALLRLRVGDVTTARKLVAKIEDSGRKSDLDALLKAADGDYSSALEIWQQNIDANPNDGMAASNLAVGLLYTGRIAQARNVLEELTSRAPAFPGMLFNLSTVYELCTEQAVERKHALAQSIAAKAPTFQSGGWERANFDFKL